MIEVADLEFGYGKEALFQNLSLNLEPGNIYGLLGRNGAGKTSLLRIFCGQLYRWKGLCSVLGVDPGRRSADMLADIFYLPEEYYLPAVKPDEYVAMYSPFYPKFDPAKFEHVQREFGLPAAKKLFELSYGQKKKFLISFGLATGCSLVLFDEPTNGLDIPSKSQFRRLVASTIDENQVFIISTHQVRDMENLIDPIIIVEDGRIIFNAGMADVSRKISVHMSQSPQEGSEVLYAEKVLGGYSVVTETGGEPETAVDLELLFNAVVDENRRVCNLFDGGERE
ncbi:MAG: ABC transporter ATP-binding protein [Spirochaetales bacterium]|jgi:ABC-2 type transport system ATP-binding protein|nr:ABC transporter ATP-binding protein [Spirochaetales bacterium]